jgi:hypothetical protein
VRLPVAVYHHFLEIFLRINHSNAMGHEHLILDCRTQIVQWQQEPETYFEGDNQAKVFYEFDLAPPESTEQESVAFTVVSILEVLNQYKGVVVNAKTQTVFTLKNQGHKPTVDALFHCAQVASQAFFGILQAEKAGPLLAGIALKKPAKEEIERNLGHSVRVQYG